MTGSPLFRSAGVSGAARAGAEGVAPCTMVIFGASGDLTVRKLIPGLYELYGRGLLPDRFAVLGAGRTAMSDEQFRAAMAGALAAALAEDTGDRPRRETTATASSAALYYQQLESNGRSGGVRGTWASG